MKSWMSRAFPVLLSVVLGSTYAAPAAAKKAPAPAKAAAKAGKLAAPTKVTSVEGITEYRLGNGLKVLLFPDPSKPTITVNMTVLVGSGHENYGETGMAHLLEHLVFKGTPKHPNIPQELTEHGARPNGSTWFDRTNYFETFRADEGNLKWALDLEADRLVNSFIAKKDLDSEMSVVRNEFEAGENQPLQILEERTVATAYLWHNYGKSTIGARSDLENVPIERLQAFYRNWYQPDNAVLLVAGNFDEPKTLALINQIYGPIPRPARVLPRIYTAEPTQDGERSVTLRRVGDVQGLCLVYHAPAGSHPDFAALDVLTEILGDTPSGRLHKALVETKMASSVAGYNYQLQAPGMLVFAAEVRTESSLAAAREEMQKAVNGVVANPPTREEVDRARTKLLKNIDLTLNQSERVGLQMSEWSGMGDWRLFFLHRDRLRKVTPEDVQRVAAAYLKPSNVTVGEFIPTPKPQRSEIPATPDVASLLADYKGDAAVTAGETFDASPLAIEARLERYGTPGGVKYALLPKKTRGGTVVATFVMRYGSEASLMNRSATADMTADMLMRGTAKHTRQQLKDEFDKLKAQVRVFGSPGDLRVAVETVRENLNPVMLLVAEFLREPSFPPSELDLLREERLAEIEQQRTDPQAIAFRAFQRQQNPFPKGDVRYVGTPEEEIADTLAATLDEVKKLYGDFYGASSSQLSVVGDFDAKETTDLVTRLLASWESRLPFARVPSVYQDVPAVNQSIETPDKANAVFLAGANLKLRDDDPDYPALVLGNYMLGGGFLNSRLATRIRQKEGISYGVGSRITASSLDAAGGFSTFAIYAPENSKRLVAAFGEEVDRMLKDGFTAEEVAAAKSGWLQSRQVNRSQDASLSGTLVNYLFFDRKLDWDAAFEKKVEALTPDVIVAAMRRHLDPKKITQIQAGDFAKPAPSAAAPAAAPAAPAAPGKTQ